MAEPDYSTDDSYSYSTPNPYDRFDPLPPPPPPPPLLAPAPVAPPALTAPLPTIGDLEGALHAIQNPQHDPFLKIAWCRDVLLLVDRAQQNPNPSTDPAIGPVVVKDAVLQRLVEIAIRTILELASTGVTPVPLYAAEAMYWRGLFASTGAYPKFVAHNPRVAFRDFEGAARGRYNGAWFRLGRDYENFKDTQRARECFERGVKYGVESCTYRMGMAHLLGQLGLDVNLNTAISLLQRAAGLATLQVPQPAYAFALVLLNEFTQASVPQHLLTSFAADPLLDARKHLERAAYLHFAPAQYKLGHAYEYAQPPFPFDPLLSVQYYSLASQQGEPEADMALSKWFLCGSPDTDVPGTGFDKDEALALTFAEKATKNGLPSAQFAMGYYAEVGVGQPKNIQNAIMWYTRASQQGNTDAVERLAALSQPSPHVLSRQEHDSITDDKLVRKRTQARQRSDVAVPTQIQQESSVRLSPSRRPPPHLRSQSTATGRMGYTLTDTPRTTIATPPPSQQQQQQQQQSPPLPPPASSSPRPPRTTPATFAEMGIQGRNAEDNSCIVM